MSKLSGFPEFLPRERVVEQQVLDHLRRTFELHGFANIETRAVEPLDVLLRKGEIDKEVYAVKRLAAGDAEPAELALHYDLTVPFARYVLENAGQLEFPFRRWQVQKVWRGERPQQGRFREFTQADIDIVARDVLPFHFDVEVARVMAEALAGLPIPTATLQISNRKVLEGFYLGLGVAEPATVMQVVDKLDKVPADKVRELLVEQGLAGDQADKVLALAEIVTTDTSFVARVEALGVEHELLAVGLSELSQVIEGASGVEGVIVTADLRIARGLDYYTGTVFETRLEGWEHLGSICSGGRYDELASDRRNSYPGVGISLGVSRLLVPLGLAASRSVPSAVLVAVDTEDSRAGSNAVAQQLRSRGIATEVAPKADKFGKQIQYAEKRGIPYVWFPPTSVKDIRSGDQVDAEPTTWAPPTEDLTPHILRTPSKEQNT
ncbi:histidine--tRNA ligase [Aeromicrobium sp.]|uniref:histidine--tRNA ligase n=1 Tax=Aeromicrobium sp. TaxID=1871063 RepID=UPI0030BEC290